MTTADPGRRRASPASSCRSRAGRWSAQLAAGAEAFVSGPSAGVLHGLRGMPTTADRGHGQASAAGSSLPPWCRLVRTSWIDEERDVVVRDRTGIRVASPLRMLFGLAAPVQPAPLRAGGRGRLAQAASSRPTTPRDYLAADPALRSHRRDADERVAGEDVARGRARRRAGSSSTSSTLIERVGLPDARAPAPAASCASGEVIHLDLAWPDVRLAVEPGPLVVARRRPRASGATRPATGRAAPSAGTSSATTRTAAGDPRRRPASCSPSTGAGRRSRFSGVWIALSATPAASEPDRVDG